MKNETLKSNQMANAIKQQIIFEIEKYDTKPKILALTETWLTKTDIEPIKQSKKGKANLQKEYSTAYYHTMLSILRDTGRKTGGFGFYLHETLTYKQIDYRSDIE